MRVLTEVLVVGQTTAISFGGASVAQVIKMMELQNDDRVDTLILMIGTNDLSRNPFLEGMPRESTIRPLDTRS